MPNVPPQRRYRESSKVLGRGSFGVVRLARDTVSGDDVVVKRVALEAGDLEEAREEVRVLRELHHPHICRVLDAWETPSRKTRLQCQCCLRVLVSAGLPSRLSACREASRQVKHRPGVKEK